MHSRHIGLIFLALKFIGGYFTAVDLAKFATELDEAEKMTMAEGGFDTAEFIRFMEQPSSNMDDSGYFSVQVCEH